MACCIRYFDDWSSLAHCKNGYDLKIRVCPKLSRLNEKRDHGKHNSLFRFIAQILLEGSVTTKEGDLRQDIEENFETVQSKIVHITMKALCLQWNQVIKLPYARSSLRKERTNLQIKIKYPESSLEGALHWGESRSLRFYCHNEHNFPYVMLPTCLCHNLIMLLPSTKRHDLLKHFELTLVVQCHSCSLCHEWPLTIEQSRQVVMWPHGSIIKVKALEVSRDHLKTKWSENDDRHYVPVDLMMIICHEDASRSGLR